MQFVYTITSYGTGGVKFDWDEAIPVTSRGMALRWRKLNRRS